MKMCLTSRQPARPVMKRASRSRTRWRSPPAGSDRSRVVDAGGEGGRGEEWKTTECAEENLDS